MEDNLVGYVLNCLDDDTQREVSSWLERDAAGRRRLEQVRQALAPLAADRAEPAPPADLAARTTARVFAEMPLDLPRAPAVSSRSAGSGRPFWRRADLAVAATLLLMVGGLTALSIAHVRRAWAVA